MSIRFATLAMVLVLGAADLRAQVPIRVVVMTDSLLAKGENVNLEIALRKGASDAGVDVLPDFGAEARVPQRAPRFLLSARVNRIAGIASLEVRTIDVASGTVTAKAVGQSAPDSLAGLAYMLGRRAADRLIRQ